MSTEVKNKAKKTAGVNSKPVEKAEEPVSGRTIRWVILGVLVARFLLTLLPSHRVDMGGYDYWSHYLADPARGFKGFYESLWVVYAPAYMYLLLISGKIAAIFQVSDHAHEFLIKSWAVLFEFAGGYLIYLIGKQLGKPKTGFWTAIFYVMNPAIFINSSIWGQFDSLFATILFGVVYCFQIKKPVHAAILFCLSVLTKPQSIFLLPLVVYVFFFQDLEWKKVFPLGSPSAREEIKAYFNKDYWVKVLWGALGVIATYVIIVLPFFRHMEAARGNPLQVIANLFMWVPKHYLKYVNDYPYATANGFNLWTVLFGQTVEDKLPFMGLTYAAWEKILLIALWAFAVWALVKIKKSNFSLYYISYLLGFGFFMFYGRMHERYLVPALIFMVVLVLWDKALWIPTLVLSMCVLVNQSYMYELAARRDEYWLPKDDNLGLFIAGISLVVLGHAFYYLYKLAQKKRSTGLKA